MKFTDYLLSRGYSSATSKSYNDDVLRFITWLDIQGIEIEQTTYNDVVGYVQHLKNKGAKQRTIKCTIISLKHFYRWHVKRRLRNDNPAHNINIKGVKRRILYNVLSRAELDKLYHDFTAVESENPIHKRNTIMLGLLVYQGLNKTDLERLEIKDLKLREGTICIASTRRSNERILKLESHQILDFMEYSLKTRETILKESKKETEQFIVTTGSSSNLQNILQKLMEQLRKQNKKLKSTKQLRASVITHWLKIHNLREVQYFAGHRYISSTENYLINDFEDLQEDINKYHPIN